MIAASMIVGLILSIVQIQQPPPFIGTWTLNVSKSNYGSFPLPKSIVWIIEDLGGGLFKQTVAGEAGDGTKVNEVMTLKCDGTDYSVESTTTNGPRFVSCVARDPNTFDFTYKDKTKQVLNMDTRVMSKDGATFTQTHKWLYRGEPVTSIYVQGKVTVATVAVFERQETN